MPILQAGWHPYTSEGLKRGVGPFVRDCDGEQILPPSWNGREAGEDTGRLGRAPSLPVTLSPHSQWSFRCVHARQNAQGEGQSRGLILKQDKGRGSQVAPARVTTPRSAGRFKGFRALKPGRIRGSHSARWGHCWGLILLKCPWVAALGGGQCGDKG